MNAFDIYRRLTVCLSILALALLATACGNAGTEAAVMTDAEAEAALSPLDRAIEVETLRIATQAVDDRVSLPADLLPLRQATLAAEIPGVVRSVHADAGDRVRRGDVLLEVDTETLEHQLAEAQAVHRHRMAQFERAEALLERRSITQQQFLDAITQRDVAAAQLARAELQLEKSKLRAPWDGTVASKHLEAGDYVQPGQAAFELVDVSRLKAVAPAPAADVPDLREGLPVEVRVDVFADRVFPGGVTRLGAMLDAGARTLDVEAEIANPVEDGRRILRPGLAARLSIPLRQLDDAIVVPLDAILDLGARDAVYVVSGTGADARAEVRDVEVARLLAGDRAVIASGLEPGDRLIVQGQKSLSPGQRVVTPGVSTPGVATPES